jgi:ubiquinone/menaquinone biosynthesis C-methylase UbiE
MRAKIGNVDFGKTAIDYLTHRAGFPESLFQRFASLGIGNNKESLLDLGTGTGSLGRGFARMGCRVTGADIAPDMIEAAREIDANQNLDTDYIIAPAEDTGLPAETFEIVSAGQCWHWFDAPAAALETARLLIPGGCIVVAHYDWLPLEGNVVRKTEKLIEQHNSKWRMGNMTGIHPWAMRELGEAGFTDIQSFSYDEPAIYTHEGWRGRIRASAGVAATLSPPAVENFDSQLAAMLETEFPQDTLVVPHRVFAITARWPGDPGCA